MADYTTLIQQSAAQYGVPPEILQWQLQQESGLNPLAPTSSTGAVGIAQILPSTAAAPGYGVAPISDPTDPAQAIPFAAAYDAALYRQTGSWTGALTRYGTLAGVPSSVTNSWNTLLQQTGLDGSGAGNSGGAAGSGSFWPDWSQLGGGAAGGAGGWPWLDHIPTSADFTPGWLALVEELAIRIMLGLVGMVLMLGGFYIAGQRSGGALKTAASRLPLTP